MHIYMHVHTCACAHTYVCQCIVQCVLVCTCVNMCACAHAHPYVCKWVCTHAYMPSQEGLTPGILCFGHSPACDGHR